MKQDVRAFSATCATSNSRVPHKVHYGLAANRDRYLLEHGVASYVSDTITWHIREQYNLTAYVNREARNADSSKKVSSDIAW